MFFSIILSLFALIFPKEQNDHGCFVRNYNLPLSKISSELKSFNLPIYNGKWLNIDSIAKVYPTKKQLPGELSAFLIKENIFDKPDKDIKSEFSVISKFKYSDAYESYLLLNNQEGKEPYFISKDLILLNIKSGSLLSVCRVATFYQDYDGYHMQQQSVYQGKEIFVNTFRELSSDFVNEDGQNIQEDEPLRTSFMLDKVSGKAKVLEN